jgi:hypothetical protein
VKNETGKTNGVAKKRQYNRKPKKEPPEVKVKAVKPVKTTMEIIEEFNNQARAAQQNGMVNYENYELGFMYESEAASDSVYQPNNSEF